MSILDTLDDWNAVPPGPFNNMGKVFNAFANGQGPQSLQTDWLRASGMYFTCPREFVLNYWKPIPSKKFDGSARMRMGCGTWWHSYMQNCVLGPLGILYGKWFDNEALETRGPCFHPDPKLTLHEMQEQATEPVWTFAEDSLKDDALRLTGHHDGIISIDRFRWLEENLNLVRKDLPQALKELHSIAPGKLMHLELKSLSLDGKAKWKTADDTPDYYKMQAVIYQHMTGYDSTMFMLADRDQFKIHTVKYDYDEGWWKETVRKARIIWEAIRDRTLPESGMPCTSQNVSRAKKCVFKTPCWDDMDFEAWVDEQSAAQPNRKWLDLSKWEAP